MIRIKNFALNAKLIKQYWFLRLSTKNIDFIIINEKMNVNYEIEMGI